MSDNDTTRPFPPAASEPDATEVLFAQQAPEPSSGTPPYGDPGTGAFPQRDSTPWNTVGDSRPTTTPARRRPRFGTILWGVILLVFAAFMVTNALVPFVLDAGTWLIGALVAAGVVLVIAGIAAAVRSGD